MRHGKQRLGKLPVKKDRRTLKLAKFLDWKEYHDTPEKVEWSKAVGGFSMMKNDELGNCAIIGVANIVKSWTANERVEITISDDNIVDAYARICGYKPVTDEDDNGCVLLDVLNYWKVIGIDGHKIEGYVSINPKSKREVKAAVHLFGAVYLGLQLPAFAENTDEWNLPREGKSYELLPGSWGGHCVVILDADDEYVTVVSWGRLIKMNWEFLAAYADEAYAVFAPDDWATDGTAPNGFDIASLRKKLHEI
jgi:hypothetical protein